MPLATDVVPGQMADDKLYAPIISRIHSTLQKQGVLYVGDCKLSSLENRLHIKGKSEGHYLCPLPKADYRPQPNALQIVVQFHARFVGIKVF